jgi:protein-L-isoaspartate(D-aspartate) O-methyltransferase
MQASLVTRIGDDEWSRRHLFETSLPPLENAPQPEAFVF